MRRLLLAIAAIALVPSEAAAAPDCQTSQKTLMASSQVRVFRSDGRTFACWVEGRRVRSLAGAQLLAVATRWVAWSTTACEFDETCAATVRVMDVRTGRRARMPLPGGAEPKSLVVDRRGIPAWIEQTAETNRVVARARSGTRIVLGEDPRIYPRSLALARSHVYWSVDGQPRSARLP